MKKIIALPLLLLAALPLAAQESNSLSPYSRYGLGTLSTARAGFNRSLEGTGLAFRVGNQLNPTNPASYAYLDSLSFLFDAGVSASRATLSAAEERQHANKAQFDYLNLGFRLAKGWGFAAGMHRFSSVGYSLSSQGDALENGTLTPLIPSYSYVGTGGLSRVYAGLGYAPLPSLSFGANVGYLWGTISHVSASSFNSTAVPSLRRTYETEIRSYTLDLAAQYHHRLSAHHELSLGLTYGLGHALSGRSSIYNQQLLSSAVLSADTLSQQRAFSLPQSFGVGLAWTWRNSLRLGLDYELQQWASATTPAYDPSTRSFTTTTADYADRHRLSLGAEYVAKPEGYTWSQRVRYRLGLSYTSPHHRIAGQDGPATYGASVGVGLPLFNKYNNRSFLNLGLHYEHLPAPTPSMVGERYLRFSLGLTFNDRWFAKWKID